MYFVFDVDTIIFLFFDSKILIFTITKWQQETELGNLNVQSDRTGSLKQTVQRNRFAEMNPTSHY